MMMSAQEVAAFAQAVIDSLAWLAYLWVAGCAIHFAAGWFERRADRRRYDVCRTSFTEYQVASTRIKFHAFGRDRDLPMHFMDGRDWWLRRQAALVIGYAA